eukprot:m.146141 g.146141  ORF g.146141 m.146141 type:complete len:53 (-) comp17241_c0_seq1:221-379(-)
MRVAVVRHVNDTGFNVLVLAPIMVILTQQSVPLRHLGHLDVQSSRSSLVAHR